MVDTAAGYIARHPRVLVWLAKLRMLSVTVAEAEQYLEQHKADKAKGVKPQ